MSIVSTKLGKLQGILKYSCFGKPYNAFLAIPYAQQPVGKMRFRDPVPLTEPWRGVLDATKVSPNDSCHQFDRVENATEPFGSDECLKLFVYTREVNFKKPKPVMVFIHGGSLRVGSGSASFYGPDYFMEHDVVLVTINYRLAVFGFLSLPDAGIRGNAGLKDQNLALKWVKENIADFGGDPGNVTLFGESSGGATAYQQMLSPMSKGLFHRSIIMSGILTSSFAFRKFDVTMRLAKAIGYTGDEKGQDILTFLEKSDPKEIVKAEQRIVTRDERTLHRRYFPFLPVIDGDFLPSTFQEMAQTAWGNQIDCILTGSSYESSFHYQEYHKMSPDHPKLYENFLLTSIEDTKDIEVKGQKLKNFYCSGSITQDPLDQIIYCVSDKHFHSSNYLTARSRTGTGRTWLGRFAVEPQAENYDFFRKMFKVPSKKGCMHMEYLLYMFKLAQIPAPKSDSNEYKIIMDTTRFLTNFAKEGNPGIAKWQPIERDNDVWKCWNIGNESSEFIDNPEMDRMKLWGSVLGVE